MPIDVDFVLLTMLIVAASLFGYAHIEGEREQTQREQQPRIRRPLPTVLNVGGEPFRVYGELDASKINRN